MNKPATALAALLLSIAAGLKPDPAMSVSEWADTYRMVPSEASPYPGKWNTSRTPYLDEVMECMSPAHPAHTVTVMKPAQTGFTEVILNCIGQRADIAPRPCMVIFPTVDLAKRWNREKLTPSIEATPRLRHRMVETLSRSGRSSITLHKRFPGGFVILTGANSAAGLSSSSICDLYKDEWDRWPPEVEDQGDPDKLANARQKGFRQSGKTKTLQGGTPTIKGQSRTEAAYLASDQRRYHVPCPHCGEHQVLRFQPLDSKSGRGGLSFDPENLVEPPVYVCEHNGCVIEEHEKAAMLLAGEWRAGKPGPGRQPGFHINTLYSPFVPWSDIAAEFVEAKGDPEKLKAFVNLTLGETWEERGDAPDHERLMLQREDYKPGIIPGGALLFTGAADVQKDGIYYELLGTGMGKECWSFEIGYLEGDTGDEDAACWQALDRILERHYDHELGRVWPLDLFAIDANYNTQAVLAWSRRHPKVMAVRGADGFNRPPLGTPTKVDVTVRGKKLARGAEIWTLGVYPIKSEFYAQLRKKPPEDGAEGFPPGYCHFSRRIHDKTFFEQLTAEYLDQSEHHGRIRYQWKARGANHFHDVRIYNMAALKRLSIDRMRPEDWQKLAAVRGVPEEKAQADMARIWNAPEGAATAAADKDVAGGASGKAAPGNIADRLA